MHGGALGSSAGHEADVPSQRLLPNERNFVTTDGGWPPQSAHQTSCKSLVDVVPDCVVLVGMLLSVLGMWVGWALPVEHGGTSMSIYPLGFMTCAMLGGLLKLWFLRPMQDELARFKQSNGEFEQNLRTLNGERDKLRSENNMFRESNEDLQKRIAGLSEVQELMKANCITAKMDMGEVLNEVRSMREEARQFAADQRHLLSAQACFSASERLQGFAAKRDDGTRHEDILRVVRELLTIVPEVEIPERIDSPEDCRRRIYRGLNNVVGQARRGRDVPSDAVRQVEVPRRDAALSEARRGQDIKPDSPPLQTHLPPQTVPAGRAARHAVQLPRFCPNEMGSLGVGGMSPPIPSQPQSVDQACVPSARQRPSLDMGAPHFWSPDSEHDPPSLSSAAPASPLWQQSPDTEHQSSSLTSASRSQVGMPPRQQRREINFSADPIRRTPHPQPQQAPQLPASWSGGGASAFNSSSDPTGPLQAVGQKTIPSVSRTSGQGVARQSSAPVGGGPQTPAARHVPLTARKSPPTGEKVAPPSQHTAWDNLPPPRGQSRNLADPNKRGPSPAEGTSPASA